MTVLCFSGGVDSFIAAHFLKREHGITPAKVYFDLGTPYSEKEKKVVSELFHDTIIDKSLFVGDRQREPNAYIPYRNLYIAMLACNYSHDIVIAGIKGDNVSDKTKAIFKWMSTLLSNLEGTEINIWSPFWSMGKSDIVRWYLNQKLSTEKLKSTVSCYSKDHRRYCGKCSSCFRKWTAFWVNGIKLTFNNQALMDEYEYKAGNNHYDESRNKDILKAVNDYRGGY